MTLAYNMARAREAMGEYRAAKQAYQVRGAGKHVWHLVYACERGYGGLQGSGAGLKDARCWEALFPHTRQPDLPTVAPARYVITLVVGKMAEWVA